jgi:ureidoglycolate hydrolase
MMFRLIAEPLTEVDWKPFGWLPLADTNPADGVDRLHFEWSDVHVNLIQHRLDEIPQTDNGLVCEIMFHHLTHTQALLVINCPAVIVVAEPLTEFSAPDASEHLRAFLLQPHDSLVLHRGTWHWGPFPVSEPRVDLYNVQGLRWAEDNDETNLAELGLATEVITGNRA